MLVKISVDNFMSFEQGTEFTMIPSNKTTKKKEHKVKVKSTSLLKYAVVYGANAAGKSNLVEVFKFIQYCVRKSMPASATTMFSKTKEENSKRTSSFELQFTAEGKFYAYGFTAYLQERKITEEWLYELYQNGSSKTLFERECGEKPKIGSEVALGKSDVLKMQTYLEDFDEKSNLLFLSFMNQGKKYKEKSKLTFFKDVFLWITESLTIGTPQTTFNNFEYYYHETSLGKINELIKTFDTGITEISIKEITQDELRKELPDPIFNEVMEHIKRRLEEDTTKEFKVSMRFNDNFFNVEIVEGNALKVTTIQLKHETPFMILISRKNQMERDACLN